MVKLIIKEVKNCLDCDYNKMYRTSTIHEKDYVVITGWDCLKKDKPILEPIDGEIEPKTINQFIDNPKYPDWCPLEDKK